MALDLSQSRTEVFQGLWAAMFAFATVILLTRLGVRLMIKQFGPEDWLIVGAGVRPSACSNPSKIPSLTTIAQAVNVAYFASGVLQSQGGIGKHTKSLTNPQNIQAVKWSKIGTTLSLLLLMTVKLSIGAQLHRLGISLRWRLVLWTTLGLYSVVTMFTMGTYVWRCRPYNSFWLPIPPSQVKCIFTLETWRNVSFFQISTDPLSLEVLAMPC
jgi:hypothetical protein